MTKEQIRKSEVLSQELGDKLVGHSLDEIELAFALILTHLTHHTIISMEHIKTYMGLAQKMRDDKQDHGMMKVALKPKETSSKLKN